jgi:hypothetical protein
MSIRIQSIPRLLDELDPNSAAPLPLSLSFGALVYHLRGLGLHADMMDEALFSHLMRCETRRMATLIDPAIEIETPLDVLRARFAELVKLVSHALQDDGAYFCRPLAQAITSPRRIADMLNELDPRITAAHVRAAQAQLRKARYG